VPFYTRDVVSAVYATATWLAGWLAGCVYVRHTPVLYQNGKPMLKLSRPPGSPINLASYDLCADTQFQAEPFQRGALNTQGWGKIAIFDENHRLSRKRCEIVLLWNVGCRIELYHFRWPWVTPNPGFKVTVYLQVEYLKNGAF